MATYKALNNLKLDNSPVKNLSQLYKAAQKYNETNLIEITSQTNYTLGADYNIDGETHSLVYKGFFDYSSVYSYSQSTVMQMQATDLFQDHLRQPSLTQKDQQRELLVCLFLDQTFFHSTHRLDTQKILE